MSFALMAEEFPTVNNMTDTMATEILMGFISNPSIVSLHL